MSTWAREICCWEEDHQAGPRLHSGDGLPLVAMLVTVCIGSRSGEEPLNSARLYTREVTSAKRFIYSLNLFVPISR